MFRRYLFILCLWLPFLLACRPAAGGPPMVPSSTATPVPTPTLVTENIIGNEAIVDKIEVMVTSALPARVFVTVHGNFPNSCVSLDSTVSTRQDDLFVVNLTTLRDPLALCTEALVPFNEQVELDVVGLESGMYTARVLGKDDTAVSETFFLPTLDMTTEGMPMSELPATCFAESAENGAFINLQDGYCLQYPVVDGYRVSDVLRMGVAAIWGPPLTLGFEPVSTSLNVYKQAATYGRSLDEIVAEVIATNPGAVVVESNATFAGEPAQVVETYDGMMDARSHYFLHNGFVYVVTIIPLTAPEGFVEAIAEQRELLWQTVSESFTWLPDNITEQFSFCPAGFPGISPYINPRAEYCLRYPSHFMQQDLTVPDITVFTGYALDPTIPESPPVTLQIMTEPANGRSLPQLIDEIVASVPELEIEQSQGMLGGETAVILTGLPGQTAGRDLYAIHQDTIYHLRLDPLDFEQLSADLALVWDTVLESFTFFPQ